MLFLFCARSMAIFVNQILKKRAGIISTAFRVFEDFRCLSRVMEALLMVT